MECHPDPGTDFLNYLREANRSAREADISANMAANTLPSRAQYLESLQEQRNTECGICIDPLTATDRVVSACGHLGHTFHHQCLLAWLSASGENSMYHRSCPTCRTDLYEETRVRVDATERGDGAGGETDDRYHSIIRENRRERQRLDELDALREDNNRRYRQHLNEGAVLEQDAVLQDLIRSQHQPLDEQDARNRDNSRRQRQALGEEDDIAWRQERIRRRNDAERAAEAARRQERWRQEILRRREAEEPARRQEMIPRQRLDSNNDQGATDE